MQECQEQRKNAARTSPAKRLSYKFQRLREQIREAILRGEFDQQLPGERELGRRFEANAKTVNKALCDLSSEGLLVRVIGRGTFLAKEESRESPIDRSKVFYAALPPVDSAPPHRMAMIDRLRTALASYGHTLEVNAETPCEKSGCLPASAWTQGTRRLSSGLVCYPCEPLSDGRGQFNDELLCEAWRRHTPVVVMGGLAPEARVNAAVPDYVDAGFRIAQHFYRIGCETVLVLLGTVGGREGEMIHDGCQTAALRFGRTASKAVAEDGETPFWRACGHLFSVGGWTHTDVGEVGPMVGLICVGTRALRAARENQSIRHLVSEGAVGMACVLEPGDNSAEDSHITSYEVDPMKVAHWAARLLIDARQGQRPVEVLVPGELCIRGEIRTPAGSNGARRSNERTVEREAAVSAIADVLI